MDLPNDLRLALERALRAIPAEALEQATAQLSARYRAGHGRDAGRHVRDEAGVAAYAAYRMPATFAAAAAAMWAVAQTMPTWMPRDLLDIGGGTGATLWAAAYTWENLAAATVIEREPAMITFGRGLAAAAQQAVVTAAAWRRADLGGAWNTPRHDLVTAAYLLGELDETARTSLVDRLWGLAEGVLLLIEPGTPQGFAIINAARNQLRAAGAWIVAPCPHQAACPMAGGDWCHFAQRVARSREQRRAKGATLGYEDEKFAYLAVAHAPGAPIGGRILRHPLVRPGNIELTICAPEGLRRQIMTRSDRRRWPLTRDLRWGDALPHDWDE